MSQKPIFSFLIFMLHSISHIRSTYNFKKCTDEMNYNYFYIYLQNLKMGANDASGKGLLQQRTSTKINFRESYDELTSGFFWDPSDPFDSFSAIFSVCSPKLKILWIRVTFIVKYSEYTSVHSILSY